MTTPRVHTPHPRAPRIRRPPTLATRILTQAQIERLVDMRLAMRVIRRAFLAQGRQQVVMPSKVYLSLPGVGDFRAMPAYLAAPPTAGIKWVNVHPGNRALGLPTVLGVVILSDPATGVPVGILDALSITRLRTGAAGGVAAKALARPDSRTVGLVGCGAQAVAQLDALHAGFRLTHVTVWGHEPGEAEAFVRRHRRRFPWTMTAASSVRACVEAADLIVTITTSHAPLVMRPWLAPGAHINAVGADAPGKQELDPQILRDAVVVVDDIEQAVHGGELNVPVAAGLFDRAAIHGTMADVLLGRVAGRRDPRQITVFDSTGIAIHDIALGGAVLRLATQRGIGRSLRVFSSTAGPLR